MRIFCIFSPWEARNPCQKHHAGLPGSGWSCMKSCGESWLMLWDGDLVLRSVLNQCSSKQNDTPQEKTKGFNEPKIFMEHRRHFSLYHFLQTNKNPQSHKLPLQDIRKIWQGTKKLLTKTEFAASVIFIPLYNLPCRLDSPGSLSTQPWLMLLFPNGRFPVIHLGVTVGAVNGANSVTGNLEVLPEMRLILANLSTHNHSHGLTLFVLRSRSISPFWWTGMYSTFVIVYSSVNRWENNNYTLLCRTGNYNQHQNLYVIRSLF